MTKGKKMSAKILTCILTPVMVVLLALAIAISIVPTMLFDAVLRDFFGEAAVAEGSSESDTSDLDATYSKSKFSSDDDLLDAERAYVRQAAGEGYVLLKNDGGLPVETSSGDKTELALFSQSSVDFIIGGTGSGTSETDVTLKDAFEDANYTVNSALWNYYSGAGASRGAGSINYGGSENWGINEISLSTLQSNVDLASVKNSADVAVFVMSRTGGEGRDLGRYMGSYTSIAEDQTKSYLEPDSVELEIIDYLNKNYDNVIILLNTNNVMEAGWTESYENIKAVLWVPGGGDQGAYALADVFSGAVSPSGHLVDTMAYDAFSSPAMANMGDFRYTNGGSNTSYYGVSYDEGIYVGYKYYETRYYDAVMGQGNATGTAGTNGGTYYTSAWDYAEEVQFPFGYGLSYTTFEWSNFSVTASGDELTVSVTVKNTGDVAGKEVVQVYVNAPYTDFDKTNHIEKAAATLVGFAKTEELAVGASETVEITVSLSDLTSYDDVVNKTYILEAGAYRLTAATDSHEAVNNFLAEDGKTTADGMTAEGDVSFVYTYTQSNTDTTTYATSQTGATITNRFDGAAADGGSNYIDRSKYLSRQDWVGTWPETHGNQDDKTASSMSEVNGYQYKEEISADLLAKLQQSGTAEAANSPVSDSSITSEMAGTYGNADGTELELIDYRGVDYDEADWFALVSQMTTSEVGKIINLSGYATAKADSINKPKANDLDGPAGLNTMTTHASYGLAYPAEVTIAATWNVEMSENHGYFVSEDGLRFASASGWYAPAMNIHRTPFAGRNFEYYAEDGFMSGVMASAAAKAAAEMGMYSFVKHFALNDQEDHRCDNGIATFCNEQAMREIYLRPFRMVSECGTVEMSYYAADESGNLTLTTKEIPAMQAVMSSFNRVGATWAGGSYQLVTEILREEWGFDGFVLTDYSQGATSYMHTEQMLRAGGDAQLTQYGTSFSVKTDANIYYTKVALSHILYTVVNSNAMNGYVHGTTVSATPFAYYYLIIIAADVVCAAGIIACAVVLALRWKKELNGKTE